MQEDTKPAASELLRARDPEARPSADPDDLPRFLSTASLQDPTLRTPGSDIPDAVYAVSDAEPFDLRSTRDLAEAPGASHQNPLFAALLALLLVAILLCTAFYLYRDVHQPASAPTPSPSSSH